MASRSAYRGALKKRRSLSSRYFDADKMSLDHISCAKKKRLRQCDSDLGRYFSSQQFVSSIIVQIFV